MKLQDKIDALLRGIADEQLRLRKLQDKQDKLHRSLQIQKDNVASAQDTLIDLLIAHIEIKEEN